MGSAPHLLQEVQIDGQKLVNGGAPLPLVLAPAEGEAVTAKELVDWIKRERGWIEEHLFKSGAVLFRGCNLKTPEDFNLVVESFGYEERLYNRGLAQRSHVVGRIYTANEAPPHIYIPFHHEMAKLPQSPSKVFFFCELAPTKGGETPLLWSNAIVERLQREFPDFLQQLEDKGLLYQNFFGDDDNPNAYLTRSWKALYRVKDREELDAKFAQEGEVGTRLEWVDDQRVKIKTGPLPALKWDIHRKQKVFFNYLAAFNLTYFEVPDNGKEAAPYATVSFGDGSPLPREQVLACQRIMAEERAEFKWEQGDVILIDNVAVQHAKNPCFSPRRVLASLVA